MRLRLTSFLAALLLCAAPVFAQEGADYDPLLDDDLDLALPDDPLPPANTADSAAVSAPAAAPTAEEAEKADAASDIAGDAASDKANDATSDDSVTDLLPLAPLSVEADSSSDETAPAPAEKKAKKEKKKKEKKERPKREPRENDGSKIHNLSLMLSGALLIDTGHVGRTSPLINISLGARPLGGKLLVAGEFGYAFFGSRIPVYSAMTYDLKIHTTNFGAKVAYWFRDLDKIGPYISGTGALVLAKSELDKRSDIMVSGSFSAQVGASIPVSYFTIMPHVGYWLSGLSGDFMKHIQLNGVYLGVAVQFTP